MTKLLILMVSMLCACLCACQTGPTSQPRSSLGAETSTAKRTGTFARSEPSHDGAYAPPGNTDDGWFYELSYAELILSPDGGTLLAMVPVPGPNAGFATPGFVLAVHELATGTSHLLQEHTNVRKIAFSPDGKLAYLLHEDRLQVTVVDLATRLTTRLLPLGGAFDSIVISDDSKHLVATNTAGSRSDGDAVSPLGPCVAKDGRNRCRLVIVDVATGKLAKHTLPSPIMDVDLAADSARVLVTWNTPATARVTAIAIGNGPGEVLGKLPRANTTVITAQHCATELHIVEAGKRALLAGDGCGANGANGVHLFELATGKLLMSAPGSGVTVSANGRFAIAVANGHQLQNSSAQGQKNTAKLPKRYGAANLADVSLVFMDLQKFSFKAHYWGPAVPRYVLSPDGKHAYASGLTADGIDDRFAHIRTADLVAKGVVGGAVRLDRAKWTADGSLLYLLSNGAVYRISTGLPVAKHVDVPGSPELMDLDREHGRLVLGEASAPLFYLVDVLDGDKVQSLHLFAK